MRGHGTLCSELVRAAAAEAGLEPGSVGTTAVERFVERSVRDGIGLDALRERVRAKEPRLLDELLSAVLVGETFFFREPAHFELVREAMDEMRATLGGIEHCEVQAERRVGRGGAIVRTQDGDVDARVETKLQRAREVVEGALGVETTARTA